VNLTSKRAGEFILGRRSVVHHRRESGSQSVLTRSWGGEDSETQTVSVWFLSIFNGIDQPLEWLKKSEGESIREGLPCSRPEQLLAWMLTVQEMKLIPGKFSSTHRQ
jgi:hypothetical protein